MLESNQQQHHLAQTVIVPVANPDTAAQMLRVAVALAAPNEGRVIALYVSVGSEAEQQAGLVEKVKPIVEELNNTGNRVEFMTHSSTGAARGILDVIREEGADLVLLGLYHPNPGHVEFGQIALNVAETAACNVLLYRSALNAKFQRVVVPTDGSAQARVACEIGYEVAAFYDKPLQLLHIQDSDLPEWLGLARIEQTLLNIVPRTFHVDKLVARATYVDLGVLARVTERDLVVLGMSKRTALEKWLYGQISTEIMKRAPGPVIMSWHVDASGQSIARRARRWATWLLPTLTDAEREEMAWQAVKMASPSLDYQILIVLSALLSALGLLLNSPAVIIGAMLVAPLMQPLIAFAIGLTTGKVATGVRAVGTVGQGIVLALVISYLAGVAIAETSPTSEMLARSSPSILDAAVALAAGFIGAYATARKDIPAALAGVAIAAALMPPLCTVGLGFQLGNISLGLGALLLFFTNIVMISVAAAVVFVWLGLRPRKVAYPGTYAVMIGLTLLTLPLVGWLLSTSQSAQTIDRGAQVNQILVDAFAPAEVVTVDITETTESEPIQIVTTVRGLEVVSSQRILLTEAALTAALGQAVDLGVVTQRVLRGVEALEPPPNLVGQPGPTATETVTDPTGAANSAEATAVVD